MVPSLTTILQRFIAKWAVRLPSEAILTVCGESGFTGGRARVLTPVTTVPVCLWQMRHGHTACRPRPHLSGLRCRATASGHARATLPRHLFAFRRARVGRVVPPCVSSEGRWHGLRSCVVDGSGCSRPEIPAAQDAFGQPTGAPEDPAP